MCTAMCDIVQLCLFEAPVSHVRVDDCRLGEGVEAELASLYGPRRWEIALTPAVNDFIARLVNTYSGEVKRMEVV